MVFAIGLTVLIAFGALSIEVGNILVVQNELQNAADAAALAGAEYLYPASSSGIPGWSSASSYASKEVALNLANGVKLTAGTVQTGYWDLTGAIKGIQSTIGSILNPSPAVQVTVSLSAGNNGGPSI